MTQTLPKRHLYQGAYREELEDEVDTQLETPANHEGNTDETDPMETPEERSWKKRYGDLRTHTNTLTERIKNLENQLLSAQKQEIRIPSSKEELDDFSRRFPDVYRHIRSIAMSELLQERETLATQTKAVQDNLDAVTRELGFKKVLQAHPDFEQINMSEQFHEWALKQPQQIQDWLFESTDPSLCIKALDLYKAEMEFMKKHTTKKSAPGADSLVKTPKTVTDPTIQNQGKKVWKTSEIRKLRPREYEKLEEELELARAEGRIEFDE